MSLICESVGWGMIELKCVQEAMKTYLERDRDRGLYATFTWFVEEVGELAEALLSGDREAIREEAADVLAWLLSIMNLVDIDMEEAMTQKYREDLERVGCLGVDPLESPNEGGE